MNEMRDHHERFGVPADLNDNQKEYLAELQSQGQWRTFDGDCEVIGYDPRCGVWIRLLKTGQERNVSERAMNRTIHPVRKVW